MPLPPLPRGFLLVATAAATLLVLAGSLAARVATREPGGDSPARRVVPAAPLLRVVPPPRPLALADLPTPECWACSSSDERPLAFEIDLDHVAPLGRGTGNVATWFAQFVKGTGPRADEVEAHRVEMEADGSTWRGFAADDPLLLEAEAWVDQATCSFYPEFWTLGDAETPIPNLLLAITLAKSWVARGKASPYPEAALEDYRRAVRLGRLLLQDDATLIQDLVGIACVRLGLVPMFEAARDRGDATTTTALAILLADHGAMRQRTSERITILNRVWSGVHAAPDGSIDLAATDASVEAALNLVQTVPERRFLLEGLFAVQVIRQLGTPEQRAKAEALLDELAAREDALIAERATAVRTKDLAVPELQKLADLMGR